ncbi:MAG: hypothetical protein WA949_03150 [Phormidesmis sp.]
MEKTDSRPKQAAVDNKSAFAGNPSSIQDEGLQHLGVDQMGESAGLDIQPEEPLATEEKLEARDQNRLENELEAELSSGDSAVI